MGCLDSPEVSPFIFTGCRSVRVFTRSTRESRAKLHPDCDILTRKEGNSIQQCACLLKKMLLLRDTFLAGAQVNGFSSQKATGLNFGYLHVGGEWG
jgi:hypothetical protein